MTRGELAERGRGGPTGARGPALAARDLSGVPHQGARGCLASVAVRRPLAALLPLVAEPRPPADPAPASRSRRHRTAAGAARAAPAPLLGAADERERLVEEAVEGGPIRLVLHQRCGERLAHRLALHADRGDGYERIERFGDRHLDAAPRAERLHEVEDARAHPPDASGLHEEERQQAAHPRDEGEERVHRGQHHQRLVHERLVPEPAEDDEEPARLGLEEEEGGAGADEGHPLEQDRVALGPVVVQALVGGDAVEDLQAEVQEEELVYAFRRHGAPKCRVQTECQRTRGGAPGALPAPIMTGVSPPAHQRAASSTLTLPSALRRSSSCFTISPSVCRTVAGSSSRTPSAHSPRAQSSVSAIDGALRSSSLRSPATKRATWARSFSSSSGTLRAMISASFSGPGKST